MDPPVGFLEVFESIQKQISAWGLPIRLTAKKNIHLTLKFLGEREKDEIGDIERCLRKIKMPPFELALGELGIFSQHGVIFWIHGAGEGILELQQAVDRALTALFKPEARFMSHLTLGRMKKGGPPEKGIREKLSEVSVTPLGFRVECFHLKESILRSEGPEYRNLKTFYF